MSTGITYLHIWISSITSSISIHRQRQKVPVSAESPTGFRNASCLSQCQWKLYQLRNFINQQASLPYNPSSIAMSSVSVTTSPGRIQYMLLHPCQALSLRRTIDFLQAYELIRKPLNLKFPRTFLSNCCRSRAWACNQIKVNSSLFTLLWHCSVGFGCLSLYVSNVSHYTGTYPLA